MPRAAAHEQIHDRPMGVVVAPVPARRPADHLELVIVAVADDVSAGVGEPAHDVRLSRGRGPVHRVGVVASSRGVHVEPALQQQVHGRAVARLCAATCSSDHSYGGLRSCSFSGCASSSAVMRSQSPCCAASNSWPSIVSASMCALSARQLANPYCFARSNCASDSCAAGFVVRSSSSRRFACLRSQSRLGFSGRERRDPCRFRHVRPSFLRKGRALSCRPLSAGQGEE